jgi:hypothetical protein
MYGSFDDIIDCFAGQNSKYEVQQFIDNVRLIEIPYGNVRYGNTTKRFYGVHKDAQSEVDFCALKGKLLSVMGVSGQCLLQVIGDSGLFSPEGTVYIEKFLKPYIERYDVVEYGFTGKATGDRREINATVSSFVDRTNKSKFIGNVVGHTVVALDRWGCIGADIDNYIVVYNDDGMSRSPEYERDNTKPNFGHQVRGHTIFGDDTIISDKLLISNGDLVICADGGVQSVLQIINSIEMEVMVILIYGLRTKTQNGFSASKFLKFIMDGYNEAKLFGLRGANMTAFVSRVRDKYMTSINVIWDPSKPDCQTKRQIFDVAMRRFMEEKVYEKIERYCTFYDSTKS